MNAKLTAALMQLATDFPEDIVLVMGATGINLHIQGEDSGDNALQNHVDVVALAMVGCYVDSVEPPEDVIVDLCNNGVDYEYWTM
jgi:hypothetical protein